ncbi:hypothetical protein LCGC14_3164520, partial [marine sediment metagenome]
MGSGFRSDPIPKSPSVIGEVPVRRAHGEHLFFDSLSGNDSIAPTELDGTILVR